jgi:hypothetical protein
MTNIENKHKPTDRGGHATQLKQNQQQARQRALAKTPCHQTDAHPNAKQTPPPETQHCSKKTDAHYSKGNHPATGADNAQQQQPIT